MMIVIWMWTLFYHVLPCHMDSVLVLRLPPILKHSFGGGVGDDRLASGVNTIDENGSHLNNYSYVHACKLQSSEIEKHFN